MAPPNADRQSRRAAESPFESRKNGQNSTRPSAAASIICGRAASVSAMSSDPATTFPRSM